VWKIAAGELAGGASKQFAKDDEGIRRVLNGGLGEKGMPAFGGL